ncbi:bifunctional uroporphyrinogen-III synthetase/response regulator domain-containing protein [Mycolicibacter heraklionensis]|uniref:Bifunctional uroporphyrinogen-III synthetase/response regulator domain-containing protein n=1 Tax=Mycolicibacter heraklionensis TaxID=512402 RepID=A0ABR5FC41_9MYCO|nr:bifunctional uroporphyrinogen-III synthetase/response regulator domain-containing protein [Mycolicibacter heraklionensis]
MGSTAVHAAGHRIEIEESRVLVDGMVKPVSPAGLAALRVLAHRPGNVVARETLLRALPGRGNNMHAVESAMLRLRTALGDSQIVATVIKRGYRLAVDSEEGAA